MAGAAHAEDRPRPEWARRALQRGRTAVIDAAATSPMAVAGVRGALVSPEGLYWKDADPAAGELLASAEVRETEGDDEGAIILYRRALAVGATGTIATRASIGLAVCQWRGGATDTALFRLEALAARAPDADLRYAASLPLAIGLAADGRKPEAVALLKTLRADNPSHPLAAQADALLWMWQEER